MKPRRAGGRRRSWTALAAAFSAYLGWAGRRVRVSGDVELAEALEAIRRNHPGRKLVLYWWQRDVLGLFFAASGGAPALKSFLGEVEYICDDTAGGRLTQAMLTRLGLRYSPLSRASGPTRARDLKRIMQAKSANGIAVDGNGPYGVVGREFVRFLASSGAVAVPIAARASRSRAIWARTAMDLPRPGALLAVSCGLPTVVAEPGANPQLDLRDRLEAARDAASRLARTAGPPAAVTSP